MRNKTLNAKKLIADCGGVKEVTESLNKNGYDVPRNTVKQWNNRNSVPTVAAMILFEKVVPIIAPFNELEDYLE